MRNQYVYQSTAIDLFMDTADYFYLVMKGMGYQGLILGRLPQVCADDNEKLLRDWSCSFGVM